MPYEMKPSEIADCLGISRSAVTQWRLSDFSIPAVMQAASARNHDVNPIWLHVLKKLNEYADSMAGSTQVNELANALVDDPNTPVPDHMLREVIQAANGKARLARQLKELRENSVDWIDRRTLEDCFIRIIAQANLAFGEELITSLNRSGISKRRAREIAEALDRRVFDWIEEIVRTANFEPTYDRPEGFNVFDGTGFQDAEAPMAPARRKKA